MCFVISSVPFLDHCVVSDSILKQTNFGICKTKVI